MNGPVRNRRRTDPQTSPIDSDEDGDTTTFTSALPSLSSTPKRRARASSAGMKAIASVDWTNAWKEDIDQGLRERSNHVSRSSSSSRQRQQSTILTSSPSHPLVSPPTSPLEEPHSHDDDSFSKREFRPRPRAGSDGNYGENNRPIYGDGKGKIKSDDEQREVMIHQVQPTDSLAGVALRYGIELAELRKANKLWASDTIHLRKVLYIPVDSQKWTTRLSSALDKLNVSEENERTEVHAENGRLSHSKSFSAGSNSLGKSASTSTVHRVPASQLSFFPPPSAPSNISKDSDNQSPSIPTARRTRPPMPPSFSSSAYDFFSLPGTSSRNVPSIFNVFSNIPSSSRVSLSSDATPSEISDDVDVELDNVERWRITRQRDGNKGKARAEVNSQDPRPRSARPTADQIKATPASFAVYTPPPVESKSVRTIRTQPTPSPQMELPTRAKPPW